MAIIIFSLLGKDLINEYLLLGTFFLLVGTIIWIKRQITFHYKDTLKEKTIKELERDLEEQKEINAKTIEELKKIAIINHKYSSKISSLEFFIKNLNKEEFSSELTNISELIKNLSEEYSSELSQNITHYKTLPKTNILTVDNMIKYMQKDLSDNNINFDFKLNIDNSDIAFKDYISDNNLETIISDLIKNAKIAISYNNKKYNSILLCFNCKEDIYEIAISDTGIPFQIDTLLNLGLKPSTTHKDTGGSGIGFMTLFEILNSCNATLIIKENNNDNNYSKTITIKFDNKNEYIIDTYRINELMSKTPNNRILLKNSN